jgi:hypothetical protein
MRLRGNRLSLYALDHFVAPPIHWTIFGSLFIATKYASSRIKEKSSGAQSGGARLARRLA